MDEAELTPIIPFEQLDKFTFVKLITTTTSLQSKVAHFDISEWILKLKATIKNITSSTCMRDANNIIYTNITILYTINPKLMDEEAWILFLQENPTFLRGKCKTPQNVYEREKYECIETLKEFYPELKIL